ncbi:phosphoadenosine phosphosulfate reductase family protein [Kitasatospora indigofera]|uniref:phosphoadenosine phosphosulfate reductase domain-containing protein n=1 Tax=Kitasatospora indigofera TaxID=67307 RepID=UPI0036D06B71
MVTERAQGQHHLARWSIARRQQAPIAVDRAASNGQRTVVRWHPIHDWSERQVWERIAATGVRYHWAYDAGMEPAGIAAEVVSHSPGVAFRAGDVGGWNACLKGTHSHSAEPERYQSGRDHTAKRR